MSTSVCVHKRNKHLSLSLFKHEIPYTLIKGSSIDLEAAKYHGNEADEGDPVFVPESCVFAFLVNHFVR